MTYDIRKQIQDARPFLYQRRSVRREEISQALGEMFGAVFGYATANGIAFAGPPTARYPEMSAGAMTIEAGMPIAGAVEPEGDLRCDALPGGPTAVTLHKGPYDQLGNAHQAIERWIDEQDAAPGGAPYEMYVNDPGEVKDPNEWLTEVHWPLRE